MENLALIIALVKIEFIAILLVLRNSILATC